MAHTTVIYYENNTHISIIQEHAARHASLALGEQVGEVLGQALAQGL